MLWQLEIGILDFPMEQTLEVGVAKRELDRRGFVVSAKQDIWGI